MYVTGTSSAKDASNNITLVWDMDDVLGLRAIKSGDFEVVDLTPRVTGLSATTAAPGSTLTIFGQNFSGAAGHLSVSFGSTPATSVTYVSDTQITAVVPFGAGTVHVQVQSGVNEVDPDTPNHNVNNPIFGYGKSTTSAADSFTFGASQTISAANSTASFANGTVASGAGDVLTITVADTSGNPVGGLPGNAFNLSFSGGTSTGTFTPVSATATQGTYTTTFTGVLAGTLNTLTITIAGVTLTIQPTITVTPGALSASVSTLNFAMPTVAIGGTDPLTIVLKDAAGNRITGLAGTAFSLTLAGGTSTGTLGAVSETATPGTYSATFTAVTPGTANTLTAVVNGITLGGHPTLAVTSPTTFSDNFASAGSNHQLTSSWTKQVGSFTVDTTAHTATAVSANNLATVNGINNANEAVSAVITLSAVKTAGLVARYAGTGDRNMYMGNVKATSTGYAANLYRNINGTWTQLFTKTYAGPVTNATLEFDVVGSSLRLYLNGALVAYASDTKLTAAGSVGMRATAGAVLKNFSAAPLSLTNPTLPFSDNFNSPGANAQLNGAWLNRVGNVSVAGGAATGVADVNLALVNGITAANVTVQADINVSAVGQAAGIVARYAGSGDQNMYWARVAMTAANTYQAALYVNVGGAWKLLKSKTVSAGSGTLRLAISGNSMTVSFAGASLFTVTDSSISAAGGVGLRLRARRTRTTSR